MRRSPAFLLATRISALTLLLAVSTECRAAKVEVSVTGLEKDLESAARANLSLQTYADRDASAAQIRRLFGKSAGEIRAALEPFGYYSVTVSDQLEEAAGGYHATFRVTLGQPVVVREIAVSVAGEGGQVPEVQKALAAFAPHRGEHLDHSAYEHSKSAVSSALLDAGYLHAQLLTHRVEVARGARSATVDLSWQSGPRFRFGPVEFAAVQFPPAFMDRFVPWHEGDYYSREQVTKLQQRLVNAGYFASVVVLPRVEAAVDLAVPIEVTLFPAKRTMYTGSVYYSTDTGAGTDLGIDRRWVNLRGDKFKTDLNVSERQQDLSLTYRVPLRGADDRILTFGVGYSDKTTDTSTSQTLKAGTNVARTWRGFTRTLGVQFVSGDFEVGGETGNSNLLYAEGTLSRKDADDLFLPSNGYSLTFGLRIAPRTPITDTEFAQLTADATWMRSFRGREWLIVRGSLGAMAVGDFDKLPPELRFFAGGDHSIRGFDYQSIGATNSAGEVIGGEFLTVASVEYEYRVWGNWGAALFVDGGDAFRLPDFNLNVAAGVGLRWKSPVGILRLDVAKPVISNLAHDFRVHISIGSGL